MRTTLAKDVKGRVRQPSSSHGASTRLHHPLHGLHNAVGNGGMQRIVAAAPPAIAVNAPQESSRAFMEPRFRHDPSGVRPDTFPGRRLLAHELAHTRAADRITTGASVHATTIRRAPAVIGELGNQATQRAAPPQSSLVVGRASDPLEHAADRAADQVMRGSGLLSTIMHAPISLRRKCSACAQEQDAGVVQRKSSGGSDNGAAPASVSATLASPGRPLDRGSLAFFGSRFGRDFSHVRVHDDAQAARSAQDIGANAYTVGSHIAFGAGQYAPASESGGHLLAHELTHVLQGSGADTAIRRQAKPETSADEADDDSDGIPGPPAPKAEAPKLVDIPLPEPKGESLGDIKGINLVEDSDYMFAQLERLAAKDGTDAPGAFYAALDDDIADDQEALENDPSDVDGVGPTHSDKIDAKKRVLHIVDHVARELEQMADSFVYEFQERARSTALNILEKNKKEALAEAFRYGLASETRTVQMSDCMFGDCTHDITTYSMRGRSPEVTGLQEAAKILLPRRRAFDSAKADLEAVHYLESQCEDYCDYLIGQEAPAQEALEKAATEFQLVMGFLGQKYPILNAFGDPDRDADDLEALSKSQDNQSMADTLGKEIFSRLKNISTVMEKIDELNIWQLPILVGLTRPQTEADTDPFFSRVADEVVDYNKPGWLEAIALLVLNIGAIILAGPTGGASLVVAAGVNAVVAIEHTKEYLLKKALAGTAFDRAKGLSMDDPSLFWLAVEWIGVGLDVGAAFKAVSTAVKAVETATEAGDAVAKSKALAELEALGTDAKTKQVVSRAMARLESAAPEEAKLAKAVGLTEKEVTSLSEAEGIAAKELEGLTASGKVAGETVASNAKISRLGHIFSCSSPCTWMREKYATILGPELIDKQPNLLREQFLKLEARAADAAEAAELAKKVGKAAEIAKTEKAVEDLEKEIAGFDQTLSKELKYRTGLEHLSAISVENGERLGVMDRELVTRLAELQPAQANRMLKLAPDALEKFGKLAAEDFSKVAKLGERDLGKLAALEPDALARIASLEPGNLSYVANLNPEALEWLSELSPKQLEKIASAQVSSPYSLRKMAENIGPKSTMSQINKQLAKAERHQAQLEKAFDAIESGDWSKIPDKASVGRHLGYEIEELSKIIARASGVDKTLHYAALNRKMLKELSEGGERVLVTQGRLKGGALRFDAAIIDFDKKTVELIDLVPTANKAHVEKTAAYIEELKKILPPGYELTGTEMRYVDAEGRVVDTLEEAAVAK